MINKQYLILLSFAFCNNLLAPPKLDEEVGRPRVTFQPDVDALCELKLNRLAFVRKVQRLDQDLKEQENRLSETDRNRFLAAIQPLLGAIEICASPTHHSLVKDSIMKAMNRLAIERNMDLSNPEHFREALAIAWQQWTIRQTDQEEQLRRLNDLREQLRINQEILVQSKNELAEILNINRLSSSENQMPTIQLEARVDYFKRLITMLESRIHTME